MIKITQPNALKPIETTMKIGETEFQIELLPLPRKNFWKAMSEFRKRKNAFNPVTKIMDLQTYFDEDNPKYQDAIDNMIDKHVINFKGISVDGETEIDGTLKENKLLLASLTIEDIEEIPVEDPETHEKAVITQKRERLFRTLIIDKLLDLAKTKVETEVKN
jgi:hypothetical protein